MHTEDAHRPTGGAAGAGQPPHRLEEQGRIALQAAPLLGLHQLEEADLFELGDRRIGDLAQVLGLPGARARRLGSNSSIPASTDCASRC